MKKRVLAMVLCFVMLISLTLAGCSSSGGDKSESSSSGSTSTKAINLNMNLTTSESSAWMVAAKEFKRIVEEETEGRYTISIYPNEQLASGDMVKGTEMIMSGAIDVDLRSCVNFTAVEPKLFAIVMPWIFPNGYDSVDEIIFNGGKGGEMVKSLIDAKGVKVLGLGENGFRQITNNKREIKTPADLKGLKFRSASIAAMMDTLKLLGADPTPMSFSEVFTALQQGTIDGQENPTDPIMSSKIYEVQKYLTKWDYSYDCLVLSVSGKVWEVLSDADKEIFTKAAEEGCAMQVEEIRKQEQSNLDFFEKEGMKITYLTEEETKTFKDLISPVYDTYRESVTDEVFEAFGYKFAD
ncbi:MAG: DctP family TRAP transporter solute-binding subunit [Lachnospiraceae bacterium]|nr:DctP family TRAP transporter solute-binding subunit [Lachnospiraceae bacterium]